MILESAFFFFLEMALRLWDWSSLSSLDFLTGLRIGQSNECFILY